MRRIDLDRNRSLLKLLGTLIDVGLVHLGYYLAFMFRYNFQPAQRNLSTYINNIPYISLVAFILFTIYGTTLAFKRDFDDSFFSNGISLMLINFSTVAIAFISRSFAFPRTVLVIAFVIQFILLNGWKILLLKLKYHLSREKQVLIFSGKEKAKVISEKILGHHNTPYKVLGVMDSLEGESYASMDQVDEIYVDSSLPEKMKNDIINYCYDTGKTIFLVPSLYDIYVMNSRFEKVDDIPLFKIENQVFSLEQRIVKRGMDVILSIGILLFTLPVSLITAAAIKFSDGGPVIFSQERVTLNNCPFMLYKFRTMIVDAEKHTGPVLSEDSDSRITWVGRIIRAMRIDELPQFVNVIKGDMSIVGPRPERDCFIRKYVEKMPEFRYRTAVKAGITGLAQVMGSYATNPSEKIKYDLLYIKRASLFMDLRLILLTIKVMFMKFSFTDRYHSPRGNKQTKGNI